MRQISIAAAATAITEIAITPPSRLLVEVLAGARGTSFDPESIGAVLSDGVSTPLGLACVEEGSGTDDPAATAEVVAWLTVPLVVVARGAVVVLAVVAGAAAVVAGACVVAVCLGGATPGAT